MAEAFLPPARVATACTPLSMAPTVRVILEMRCPVMSWNEHASNYSTVLTVIRLTWVLVGRSLVLAAMASAAA